MIKKKKLFLNKVDQRAYRWLYVFLILSLFAALTPVLWHIMPPTFLYYSTRISMFASFLIFFFVAIKAPMCATMYHRRFKNMFLLGLLWVFYCTILGFVITPEKWVSIPFVAIYFASALLFAYIGGICQIPFNMIHFYLWIYLIVTVIMFFTQDIHIPVMDEFTGALSMEEDNMRNTDTVAYQCNNFMYLAPFFFFRSVFEKEGIGRFERLFGFVALVPFVYFIIGRNLFRSGIAILLFCFALAGYYSLKKGKILSLFFVLIFCLAGGLLYFGSSGERMRDRIADSAARNDTDSLFDFVQSERGKELSCLLEDVPAWRKLVGSGFCATYDASEIFGLAGLKWGTIHLGIVITFLHGGIFFFIYFILLFARPLWLNKYVFAPQEGFVLSCKCYVMVLLLRYCFCPMNVGFGRVFPDSLWWFVLGVLWADYQGKMRENRCSKLRIKKQLV